MHSSWSGTKCEFIRPSITNGNGVSGWRGVALLMAVQFLLPTLTCYEKSGNFPRKTSAASLFPSFNQKHPMDV